MTGGGGRQEFPIEHGKELHYSENDRAIEHAAGERLCRLLFLKPIWMLSCTAYSREVAVAGWLDVEISGDALQPH